MRKSPKISITIPADLLEDVQAIANKSGRSLSNTIAYLAKKGAKLKQTEDHIIDRLIIAEDQPTYTTKIDKQKLPGLAENGIIVNNEKIDKENQDKKSKRTQKNNEKQ